ncbi:hypothetical protein [Roseomonas sp. 18066]|nr:hypothetical protein [Roseomonas sp. 18066]
MTRTLLLLTAAVTLMMATAPGGLLGPSVAAPQASASPSRPAPTGA